MSNSQNQSYSSIRLKCLLISHREALDNAIETVLRTLTPDPPIVWESTRHKCLSQSLLSPHSTAWPAAAAFWFWWQHLTCHKISHKKPIISTNNTLQHYSTFTCPKYLILHILLALVCYPPLYDILHDPNETQPVIDITIKLSLYYLYLVLHELPAALQIFYDNAFLKHKVKQKSHHYHLRGWYHRHFAYPSVPSAPT